MSRRRVVHALAAVCVLVTVSTVGPAGPARADAPGVDQITGNGETASAVTASWSQGLLGADNQTVVAPRDPNSSLKFMYDDFKSLKVTVSQTESLVNQSVKVTWSGGKPTVGTGQKQGDFLQLMQCYGDTTTGPDPENCQYGSKGMLGAGTAIADVAIGSRAGRECVPNSLPSTDFPSKTPGGRDGSFPNNGCDTREPTDASHDDTTPGSFGFYRVPFVPVGTTDKLYDAIPTPQYANYFDRFSTNEVQLATTSEDGTGQQFFQAQTTVEAPGLGCGALRDDGTPRDCWLVIVPRGEYKPNGYKISTAETSSINFLNDSPLGASNWAQRIQIHLSFAPVAANCPIGSANERQTVGTEVVSHAVFSWQLALNRAADCKTIYGYTAVPESTSTSQLTDSSSGVGLAFTTIPIGGEAARKGAPVEISEPIVYAPLAVSALTFAFNINVNASGGYVATPIKLTPRLLAKALTQSYKTDLPDFTNNHAAPPWASHNPDFITSDPEFTKLNPGVHAPPNFSPLAPLLTENLSALNQQAWAWILTDKAARDWLSGKPDDNGMVINPNYNSDSVATATGPATAVGAPDPAVATAITKADGFTQKQVAAMYDKCAPQIVNGVTYDPTGAKGTPIHLYVPQPGSVTRNFWATTLGFDATTPPSCVHDHSVLDPTEPIEEYDGTIFAQDANAFGPFSIAQWVSQKNYRTIDRRHNAELHKLNGIAPLTAGGTFNTSYPITRTGLKLYQAPIDSFPRADPTCFITDPDHGEREPGRCTLNLLSYVNNYADAATRIRSANQAEGAGWDPNALAPDGSTGWYVSPGVEPPGQQFVWGVTDSASVATYGLVPASLCDAAGQHCVGPSTSSVTTALTSAKPDSTGVLHIDPAHPGSGGYPLVNVTYAAARLDQPAAARNDYAALIQYGATTGQTPGVDPGQLPRGYLPLPTALRNQAQAAAAELRCGQNCPTNQPGGASQQPPGSNVGGSQAGFGATGLNGGTGTAGTGSGAAGGTGSTTGSGPGPGGANGNPSSAHAAPGSGSGHGFGNQPPAQLAGKTRSTPGASVGVLRWALLAIAIAGLVGVGAVQLSKTDAIPRLLRTLRR